MQIILMCKASVLFKYKNGVYVQCSTVQYSTVQINIDFEINLMFC
jgi:hypothetical protein